MLNLVAYKGASSSGTDSIRMERPRTTAEGLSAKPVCRAILQSESKRKRSRETTLRYLRTATANRIHTAHQLRLNNKRRNAFAPGMFSCQRIVHSQHLLGTFLPLGYVHTKFRLSNIPFLASVLLPAYEAALDFDSFHDIRT
jgi:hypothetical protein